jgi:hypothetical protein
MHPTEDDTRLSPEEVQIIGRLHIGGHGPVGLMAAGYTRALRLLIIGDSSLPMRGRSVVPRVAFRLADVRDPRSRPGRPSRIAAHQKRHAGCRLYRALAFAAVEALTQLKAEDRNARRRNQRGTKAAIRQPQKAGDHDTAVAVGGRADRDRRANADNRGGTTAGRHQVHRGCVLSERRSLVERHTRLRGERRQKKLGEILAALNVASPENSAVRQRFRRILPNLKAAALRQ